MLILLIVLMFYFLYFFKKVIFHSELNSNKVQERTYFYLTLLKIQLFIFKFLAIFHTFFFFFAQINVAYFVIMDIFITPIYYENSNIYF